METKHSSPQISIPRFNPEWIIEGISGDAIKYANELATVLVQQGLSTSQIRNFYGELKRIQLNKIEKKASQASFLLLHPKLAYAAKRAGKKGAETFKIEVLKWHAEVKVPQDGYVTRFKHFCDFCEAVLAFHKANGGN